MGSGSPTQGLVCIQQTICQLSFSPGTCGISSTAGHSGEVLLTYFCLVSVYNRNLSRPISAML